MPELPNPNPGEMGIEEEQHLEDDISIAAVLEVCRTYNLPPDQMEELKALDDVIELIATASIWIQEEGHDLDEFLTKIGAQEQ